MAVRSDTEAYLRYKQKRAWEKYYDEESKFGEVAYKLSKALLDTDFNQEDAEDMAYIAISLAGVEEEEKDD